MINVPFSFFSLLIGGHSMEAHSEQVFEIHMLLGPDLCVGETGGSLSHESLEKVTWLEARD